MNWLMKDKLTLTQSSYYHSRTNPWGKNCASGLSAHTISSLVEFFLHNGHDGRHAITIFTGPTSLRARNTETNIGLAG